MKPGSFSSFAVPASAVAVTALVWVFTPDRTDRDQLLAMPPMAPMSGMAPMPNMAPMPGMDHSQHPPANPPALSEEVLLGSGLYILYCAECHGPNLEGQPNWQTQLPGGGWPAPPLNFSGHASMHGDATLFAAIKYGPAALYPDTPIDMPAFDGVLTDDNIRAVIAFIKTSW